MNNKNNRKRGSRHGNRNANKQTVHESQVASNDYNRKDTAPCNDNYSQSNLHSKLSIRSEEFASIKPVLGKTEVSNLVNILAHFEFLSTSLLNLYEEFNLPPKEVRQLINGNNHIFCIDSKTVTLKPNLMVCKDHNSDNGCQVDCKHLHICSLYINEQCIVSSCVMGHNWRTNHNDPLLFKYCLVSLPPSILCNVFIQSSGSNLSICENYNQNKCHNDTCRSIHICLGVFSSSCNKNVCSLNHSVMETSCQEIIESNGISTRDSPRDIFLNMIDNFPLVKHQVKCYESKTNKQDTGTKNKITSPNKVVHNNPTTTVSETSKISEPDSFSKYRKPIPYQGKFDRYNLVHILFDKPEFTLSFYQIYQDYNLPPDTLMLFVKHNADLFIEDNESVILKPILSICKELNGIKGCYGNCGNLHYCIQALRSKCTKPVCAKGHKWRSDHNDLLLEAFNLKYVPFDALKQIFLKYNTWVPSIDKNIRIGVCKFYNQKKGKCFRGNCELMHICWDVFDGGCNRYNCKLNHDVTALNCKNIIRNIGGWGPIISNDHNTIDHLNQKFPHIKRKIKELKRNDQSNAMQLPKDILDSKLNSALPNNSIESESNILQNNQSYSTKESPTMDFKTSVKLKCNNVSTPSPKVKTIISPQIRQTKNVPSIILPSSPNNYSINSLNTGTGTKMYAKSSIHTQNAHVLSKGATSTNEINTHVTSIPNIKKNDNKYSPSTKKKDCSIM